jgi:hypothetical protein
MSAAVAISPVSGSVIHTVTACQITATGLSNNDSTAYDAALYPSEPELRYYFKMAATGHDSLISPQFAPSEAGLAEWHSVIVPAAATWTLTCNKVSDDSAVATASVTVS